MHNIPFFLQCKELQPELHLHMLNSIMESSAGSCPIITGSYVFSGLFNCQPKFIGLGRTGLGMCDNFQIDVVYWLRRMTKYRKYLLGALISRDQERILQCHQ